MSGAWYERVGNDSDVCISTRARLARNIKGYPFGDRLTKEGRRAIIQAVDDALSRSGFAKEAEFIDFDSISENKAMSKFEKHYVSSDFISAPLPKQLVVSKADDVAIMIGEEDHLRIQSIVSGFDLKAAYETANRMDDLLSESIEFCFDDKLGYLTKCPTNLGTGLRLSVMMHLPALTMTKQITQIIKIASQLGFTVRGFYGEGSEAKGYLYQISNQETLGFSEKQICDKMESFARQLIEKEKAAREHVYKTATDEVEDTVARANGLLRYAKLISAGEYVKLYSDIRLGISLGLNCDIGYEVLNKILMETAPHALYEDSEALPSENVRDKKRAEVIKALIVR